MQKHRFFIGTLFLVCSLGLASAASCPDPDNSSLQWGEIPSPWQENPFSEHQPQPEEGTAFVRANLLVLGRYGVGATCTYKNSIGEWSIWLDKPVKLPTKHDLQWIEIVPGFVCHEDRALCEFYY